MWLFTIFKQQSCCKIFTYEIVKHHNHSHHCNFFLPQNNKLKGGGDKKMTLCHGEESVIKAKEIKEPKQNKRKFVNVLRENTQKS